MQSVRVAEGWRALRAWRQLATVADFQVADREDLYAVGGRRKQVVERSWKQGAGAMAHQLVHEALHARLGQRPRVSEVHIQGMVRAGLHPERKGQARHFLVDVGLRAASDQPMEDDELISARVPDAGSG